MNPFRSHPLLARFAFGSAARKICARWIVLLLCLATWRGPIPCLHAHGSMDRADARLESHLHVYHEHQLARAYFDWHVHLLLPWERFEFGDSPDDPEPPHDPLTQEGAVVAPLACSSFALALSNAWMCWQGTLCDEGVAPGHRDTLQHRPLDGAIGSFTGSLLLTAPLRAITGVALC